MKLRMKYYSGEFDIEWGRDIVKNGENPWHNKQMDMYNKWLIDNGKDISDQTLSLGYLPIGQVNLKESFDAINLINEIFSSDIILQSKPCKKSVSSFKSVTN